MWDKTKVLAALASAGAAGLTQTQISVDVLGRNRSATQIRELIEKLAADDVVERWKEPGPGRGGRHVWKVRVTSYATDGADAHAADEFTPAEGEGWVLWSEVLRIAEAGVPRGYALRQGKKHRAQARRRNKSRRRAAGGWPDEQYGARRISRAALHSAVYSGMIERRGDWCRLLREPTMMPRRWMEVAYQILGDAHPTLTGQFIPKPAKTLASVLQAHLGRELLPEEFVRRRPGRAGSWDPADMKLHSRMLKPTDVEENAQRLADYEARVAEAPAIVEHVPFMARLPKSRG
jgi:hypothetical protein